MLQDPPHPVPSWSNRILLLTLAGIVFVTLYPFRFEFGRHLARPLFPFSLAGTGKHVGLLDDSLNVLLFIPFGFGLARKFRDRGISKRSALALAVGAGCLLSYTIEFLQIYIPQRDSGWEDVLTNTLGGTLGAALAVLVGGAIVRLLIESERSLAAMMTLRPTSLVLAIYFSCWCVAAAIMQTETRLSRGDPNLVLVLGNTAENGYSRVWKGRILSLEIWDHALPSEVASRLTTPPLQSASDSLVDYGFLGPAPFRDQRRFLSELTWVPSAPLDEASNDVSLDGSDWLATREPVTLLVDELRKTGQLSVRLTCVPSATTGVDARILSLSSNSGDSILEIRQKSGSLVFWPHTRQSRDRGRMSWTIPNVFEPNQERNLLLSFDGSDASAFVDGIKQPGGYRLGPGVSLARLVHRPKAAELEAYQDVFYAAVFFPLGCVIGLAWEKAATRWSGRFFLLLQPILFSAILELVLTEVSGRPTSLRNIILSIVLVAGGATWISLDRSLVSWRDTEAQRFAGY